MCTCLVVHIQICYNLDTSNLHFVWMIYSFNCSPNESGARKRLGRLKDTSGWEKRKIKGSKNGG